MTRPRMVEPRDALDALCWCGHSIGPVSAEDIRQGRTFSCGPRCNPERFGLT